MSLHELLGMLYQHTKIVSSCVGPLAPGWHQNSIAALIAMIEALVIRTPLSLQRICSTADVQLSHHRGRCGLPEEST